MTSGYRVILADPPWSFQTRSALGRNRSPDSGLERGAAPRHYPTIPFADLKTLPVGDWAAPDAALFLWVPDPFLPAACELAAAWGGFTFRTVAFYWVKTTRGAEVGSTCIVAHPAAIRLFPLGMGYHTRGNPEQCWLFMRGRVARKARDVEKLIIAPRQEHSRKPDIVHAQIERLFDGPWLELFARRQMPGWQCWGNQLAEDVEAGNAEAIAEAEGASEVEDAQGGDPAIAVSIGSPP